MSKRTTNIVSYLTWIGLVVAFLAGDRRESRFHLNQALVLTVCSVVWAIVYRVAWHHSCGQLWPAHRHYGGAECTGDCRTAGTHHHGSCQRHPGEEKPLPLIGGITLLH